MPATASISGGKSALLFSPINIFYCTEHACTQRPPLHLHGWAVEVPYSALNTMQWDELHAQMSNGPVIKYGWDRQPVPCHHWVNMAWPINWMLHVWVPLRRDMISWFKTCNGSDIYINSFASRRWMCSVKCIPVILRYCSDRYIVCFP